MNKGSMTPANLLFQPENGVYRAKGRLWQGIPAIERTKNGRLFAAWYSGKKTEEPGNFVVVEKSDDDGTSWTDAWLIIEHDDPAVRCFDECLWMDPLDRLWVTWTQSSDGLFDGRDGVWAVICDKPDADNLVFSKARRIANGLMMNKPTVLQNGEWLFPCAVWNSKYNKTGLEFPELNRESGANVYVSADAGNSFTYRGGAIIPERDFDEHMLVEQNNGCLWMLVRTTYGIGQAFSDDSGRNWRNVSPSGHNGPNSRFFIRRLASGRLLMINHVNPTNGFTNVKKRRDNLMAMLSEDDGATWMGGLMLDARASVSYPDAVETPDRRIYSIHDRDRYGAREIILNVFTENDILSGQCADAGSRLRVVINKAEG